LEIVDRPGIVAVPSVDLNPVERNRLVETPEFVVLNPLVLVAP